MKILGAVILKTLLLSFVVVRVCLGAEVEIDISKGYTEIEPVLTPFDRTAQRKTRPHMPSSLKPTVRGLAYSTNWSGYAVETSFNKPKKNSVSAVYGSWTIPTVTGTLGDQYSSAWIGIDGYQSSSVEQIGTEHDWMHGTALYYAWFEMYPRSGFIINNFPINPGDSITASIVFQGNGVFLMRLSNNTRRITVTIPTRRTTNINAKRNSAEWIVEAPYLNGVLPLAQFSTVSFAGCTATINGRTGPINDATWANNSIIMQTHDNTAKAVPSNLVGSGRAFSVSWAHQ